MSRIYTTEQIEQIRLLAQEKRSDQEIADEMGMSRRAVGRIRAKHKITSGTHLKRISNREAVREGSEKGMNLDEISEFYGIDPKVVYDIAVRSNPLVRIERKRSYEQKVEIVRKLAAEWMVDSDIATEMGEAYNAIRDIRIKNEIESGHTQRHIWRREQVAQLVRKGKRDVDISKLLEISITTVVKLRADNDLEQPPVGAEKPKPKHTRPRPTPQQMVEVQNLRHAFAGAPVDQALLGQVMARYA